MWAEVAVATGAYVVPGLAVVRGVYVSQVRQYGEEGRYGTTRMRGYYLHYVDPRGVAAWRGVAWPFVAVFLIGRWLINHSLFRAVPPTTAERLWAEYDRLVAEARKAGIDVAGLEPPNASRPVRYVSRRDDDWE